MRIVIILLCVMLPASLANAAAYTIGGRCHFLNDEDLTQVRGNDHNFPGGTLVQLLQGNDVVAETLVGADGRYSFYVETAPTSDFRVRMHLKTMRGLNPRKGRVHLLARFEILFFGYHDHDWYFDTNPFEMASADASNHLELELFFGRNTDGDTSPTLGSGTGVLREWTINNYSSYNEQETVLARCAAVMLIIDKMHRDVSGSGKIVDYGDRNGQATQGQQVYHPAEGFERFAGGFASPQFNWDIHLQERNLRVSTASHEYSHVIHYHTTSLNISDLSEEFWGHNHDKETNPKVAYAEGWADYASAAFIESHQWLVSATSDVSNPATGRFWWKGKDNNGTDNSGEIVEGAVARTFWNVSPSGGFLARIEPVWRVIRHDGTTTAGRNGRKTFEDFYDTWMAVNTSEAERRKLRQKANIEGIVYSRLYLDKYARNLNGDLNGMRDEAWVSAKSRFTLKPLDEGDLDLVEDVDEVVTHADFQVHLTGRQTKFDYGAGDLSDAAIVNYTRWRRFALDSTKNDGFTGTLDAAAMNLGNKFYVIRGTVIRDNVPPLTNTYCADTFAGPVLGNDDASGKTTAEHYHSEEIIYQVKVDKVAVKAVQRKPAAN